MAQCWVIAHIQVTPEEAAQYKGVPVVYDGDYGFFFEPNELSLLTSAIKAWLTRTKGMD